MMKLAVDARLDCLTACDEVARELLEDSHVCQPPVDALHIAARLRLDVVYDASQAGRARIKRLRGRSAIFLKPDDRPERLQWATAHEIGEAMAGEILHRTGADRDDLPILAEAAQRERVANEFASRLLLPAEWFLPDARETDCDLLQLKELYATASHELILMNLLRLEGLAMATVFDHGRVTRRRGNGELPPPPLLPLEREVWRRVHDLGRPCELSSADVRVQGWPVHEAGWKRELLRTTPADWFCASTHGSPAR
jgi:hypothetical protein